MKTVRAKGKYTRRFYAVCIVAGSAYGCTGLLDLNGTFLASTDASVDVGVDGSDSDAGNLEAGGVDATFDASQVDGALTDASLFADGGDAADVGLPQTPEFTSLATGGVTSCGVYGHILKCWGFNADGQLGLGDTVSRGYLPNQMGAMLPAIDPPSGVVPVSVAIGGFHACASFSDLSIRCWGRNTRGQLGTADTLPRGHAPGAKVASIPQVALGAIVRAGEEFTCALVSNQVFCWGANSYGQLGLGDNVDRTAPSAPVPLPTRAKDIALGKEHVCAWLDDNSVVCWGRNQFGQLGQGDTLSRGDNPNEMSTLRSLDLGQPVQILRAGGNETCAGLQNGTWRCWGSNASGELGLGDTRPRGTVAGEIPALPPLLPQIDIADLSVYSGFVCARTTSGEVYCWGDNTYGQLGQGDTVSRGGAAADLGALRPTPLGDGQDAIKLSAGGGGGHVCAILRGPSLKCWGQNFTGSLGLGDDSDRGGRAGQMGDALPSVIAW